MAFPRFNSHITTVIVLTATAAAALSLPVCVLLVPPSSQDDHGGYFPQCPLPQAARHGQALCRLSRHIQDRLDGRVYPRNGLSQEKGTPSVRGVCWERVKMVRPIIRPADHRWQGDALGSCRRASGSASSWVSTSTRLTTNKPDHRGKLHEQARPPEET